MGPTAQAEEKGRLQPQLKCVCLWPDVSECVLKAKITFLAHFISLNDN